jgi:uncharacterized phage-associated protein
MNMSKRADHVLDYLLRKGANAHGALPTQLALLKLLYFVEGWSWALLGRALVDEPMQAWKLGPVVVSQRDRMEEFKERPVPLSIAGPTPEKFFSIDETALMDAVWQRYAVENPGSLVGLTHLRGSPWAAIRKTHGVPWGAHSRIVIPSSDIRDYFTRLHRRARDYRISRMVEEHRTMSDADLDEEQDFLMTEWLAGSDGVAWVTQH